MSTNLSELDPDSPEYEAAVEAALRAEDEEHGKAASAVESEGEQPEQTATTDGAPATEVTTEAQPQPAAEPSPEKPAKPAGVLSKDGKHVLPYGALQGARREAQAERQAREAAEARAADLEQQVADLRAGKKPTTAEGEDLTPEQLAEIETDFPALAPLVAKVKRDSEELKAMRKPAAAPAASQEAEDTSDPLQDAIDSVPLLAEWQASKDEKWERAKAIDRALEGSPKWKGKPLEDRFAHVARQVAGEFDIPVDDEPAPDTTSTNKPPAKAGKQPPEKVIQAAARTAPNTLSDFKGGAPDPSRDAIDRMPPQRMLARMSEMTDDEIDALLAKAG